MMCHMIFTFCPGNINGEINKIELNTSFKRPDNMSAWSQSERNVTLKEAGKKEKNNKSFYQEAVNAGHKLGHWVDKLFSAA